MARLEIAHVSLRFGGVYALQDVSVEIGAGELVAIIGPNGAGKTSLKGMSVLDNLLIGRHFRQRTGLFAGGFYYGPGQKEEIAQRKVVEEIIDFLEIEHIRKKIVHTLPYGLQKRVELARALALEPKLLLLDEPMAGMNNEEKEDMARFILDVNEEKGTSILMIEHDMGVVMDLSHRIYVLNFGKKIAEGAPEAVRSDREVQLAYLGAEA